MENERKKIRKKTTGKVLKASKVTIKKERQTARKTRQARFLIEFLKNDFNIGKSCELIGITRRAFDLWIVEDQDFSDRVHDIRERKIDALESALFERVKAGDTTAIIFSLKTIGKQRGYIEGERVKVADILDTRALAILEELILQKIDAMQAGLAFTRAGLPIPEIVKLMIGKMQAEPPVFELPVMVADAELERMYIAQKAKNELEEHQWLPERKLEVAALKDEVKHLDSFDANSIKTGVTR